MGIKRHTNRELRAVNNKVMKIDQVLFGIGIACKIPVN
jgi:hypothetical protein